MLTADETPTRGTAFLHDHDLLREQEKVRRYLGYCPQFDALLPNLTARETLMLYARLKGLHEEGLERYVTRLLALLSLSQYADQPCGGYSGGNKRKLSVGIALVGSPPIVFLDEPSTGMDPSARRFMWRLIRRTMAARSVILTTHSMDECVALCGRIGILVNGTLQCLGNVQHLKHRYGQGYQLELHVVPDYSCLSNHVPTGQAVVDMDLKDLPVPLHFDTVALDALPLEEKSRENIQNQQIKNVSDFVENFFGQENATLLEHQGVLIIYILINN